MRLPATLSLALAAMLPALLGGTPPPLAAADQTGTGQTGTGQTGTVQVWPEGCKPEAPLGVELVTGRLPGGPLRVDFRLTPGIDVLGLDVAVRLLGSAEVLDLDGPQSGPHSRGAAVGGRLTLDLPPAGAGGADLTFTMTLADSTAPGGQSTLSVERRVQRGDLPRQSGAVIVEHNGQSLAQIPSTLRPRKGR